MAYRSHLALFRPKGGEGESERESCPFVWLDQRELFSRETPAVKAKKEKKTARHFYEATAKPSISMK